MMVREKSRKPATADPETLELLTNAPEETLAIGALLGRELRPPAVVLLQGPLGSGKTTLARGIAQGLGIADSSRVCSPSFALVNIYDGRCPIYHIDLYRLADMRDYFTVGVDEFIGARGVTIVEWGERLPELLPSAFVVRLEDAGGDCRRITIRGTRRLLRRLRRRGQR